MDGCMYVCMYVSQCPYVDVCNCMQMHVGTYVHNYIYMYIYAHMYTCVYV